MGRACQNDRPGIGEFFHPGGQMNRFSYRVVIHRQIIADRVYNDLTGIHPHAQRDVVAGLAI